MYLYKCIWINDLPISKYTQYTHTHTPSLLHTHTHTHHHHIHTLTHTLPIKGQPQNISKLTITANNNSHLIIPNLSSSLSETNAHTHVNDNVVLSTTDSGLEAVKAAKEFMKGWLWWKFVCSVFHLYFFSFLFYFFFFLSFFIYYFIFFLYFFFSFFHSFFLSLSLSRALSFYYLFSLCVFECV